MKVTATNRDSVPRSITAGRKEVGVGKTASVIGCTAAQAAQEISRSSRLFCVSVQQDPSDYPLWYAYMDTPANPGSGVKAAAGQGVVISSTQASSTPIAVAEPVGLQLFDDANCMVPSAFATFGAASAGTVTDGANTNAIEGITTTGGLLTVTVNIPVSAVVPYNVWIKAFSIGYEATQSPRGGTSDEAASTHILDTTQVHEISFT